MQWRANFCGGRPANIDGISEEQKNTLYHITSLGVLEFTKICFYLYTNI